MDVNGMLEEMRAKYALVLECIASFERLEAQKPRRGRPPAWVKAAKTGREPAEESGAPVARKRGKPGKKK